MEVCCFQGHKAQVLSSSFDPHTHQRPIVNPQKNMSELPLSTPGVADGASNSADGTKHGSAAATYTFGMSQDAWDSYLRFRPAYPESQWHTWLDYHQGPLDVLHEVGTGCGIGAASLLRAADTRGQPVRRAILSDPTASNLATSRALLTPLFASGPGGGTELGFHQQPAEASFLAPGSVDMAIACECLHFTEIDASMARLHESLRPGGTLAAVFYDVTMAEARGSPRATRAFSAVVGDFMMGVRAGRHRSSGDPGAQRRRVHFGLSYVPLGPDRWTDVRRVYINTPEGQTEWPVHPAMRALVPGDESMVDEEREALEWTRDPEGWGVKDCTAEWIRGMLGTLQLDIDPEFWEGPSWKEMLDAVDEQGGKIWLVLRANYIMARKK